MKRKLKYNEVKEDINSFISNNKLFLLFVLLSVVLGFFLRISTINGRIYFKAFVCDLFVALLVGSFAFIMKPKSRYIYYFIWLFFFTGICIGNTIYHGFYQSFLSVSLLATSSMIGQVNDAFFDKLKIQHFLYLIVPIIYFVIYKYLLKKSYCDETDMVISKKIFKRIYIVLGVILIYVLVTFTSSDGSRFVKLWNRESVVSKYGVYIYTANDLIQSIQPRINTLFGYDEAAYKFREFYACKREEKKEPNEYTNIFKGKNVIFIHGESIQNFLIDLKINGKYVTPNLNKLAKAGIYFDRFYPQISIGTSSDTEFTLLTGLMPSSSGTVFVNYFDRTYKGMPEYFNKLGYYTFSVHANNREYWNRNIMHKNLGYQDFYAKDGFVIPTDTDDPDYVGLGLSDKAFFKQFIPILRNIKDNHTPYMGTIITLSNHAPFNDVEKYGDFDVTMNYKITLDDGSEESANAPYLEGTSMGNYIKSSHYADEALGELFNNLKSNNLLDDTIIIFYGDHEARLGKKDFDVLYNYDPLENSTLSKNDENYIDVYGYQYDLLKNTPLIIWSNDREFNLKISNAMGMYDMLPTIANMFGFSEEYSLGHDIFSNNEHIVVFPNGNVLTDKVYYSDLNDEYIAFDSTPIDIDYINNLKEYADNILEVSNGIVTHDLIKRESSRIGECKHE